MALVLADRVQETTTTSGTGSVILAGAVAGFQTFAVIGNGNTCYYTIVDTNAWEVGIGTYSTTGPTLARTTVLSNSNGNASPITLSGGTSSVFVTYPAERSVNLDASNNVSPLGTIASGTWQGSTIGVAYGGTNRTVGNYSVYSYEVHVSQIDGNDTTGDGTIINPVATIVKALTLVTGDRRTVIVHPGTYTENPVITYQYTALTTPAILGGNTVIIGTVSASTGSTISGLKMTNLTITTPAATGNVNVLNCEVTGTITKSGAGDYTLIRFCDVGTTNVTGSAGTVAIFGGNSSFLTVNNAGARVIAKNATLAAPVLTAGTLTFQDSIIVATGSTSNALTTAAGSLVTITNTQIALPTLNGVARISLSGFYGIDNILYDKTNSTLVALSATGGPVNNIAYFQTVDADNLVLTNDLPIAQGGTGQSTATAAFNALAPSQTSNSGKYLTTNGTNTSWVSPINPITINSTTVTTAITIDSGQNGFSIGPMTVGAGGSVTIASGQSWVIY